MAVEEGATLVRVGRAIFGERPPGRRQRADYVAAEYLVEQGLGPRSRERIPSPGVLDRDMPNFFELAIRFVNLLVYALTAAIFLRAIFPGSSRPEATT